MYFPNILQKKKKKKILQKGPDRGKLYAVYGESATAIAVSAYLELVYFTL